MTVRRRATRSTPNQPDLVEQQFGNEEHAENKLIYVWKSLLEIYGPRWTETNGSDPLGKHDPKERKEMWLDECRMLTWPQLKNALYRLRRYQKPGDYWLPDLPTFIGFSGKGVAPTTAPAETAMPPGTWVDSICGKFYLYFLSSLPIKQELIPAFTKQWNETRSQFNSIIEEDETVKPVEVVITMLRRFAKVPNSGISESMLLSWERAADKKFAESQKRSSSKAASSYLTPSGHSIAVEPSNSES